MLPHHKNAVSDPHNYLGIHMKSQISQSRSECWRFSFARFWSVAFSVPTNSRTANDMAHVMPLLSMCALGCKRYVAARKSEYIAPMCPASSTRSTRHDCLENSHLVGSINGCLKSFRAGSATARLELSSPVLNPRNSDYATWCSKGQCGAHQ